MVDEVKPPSLPGFYELERGDAPSAVLARIDERTKNTAKDVEEMKSAITEGYVTKTAFASLQEKVALHQKIIFGFIAVILLAFMAALTALVFQKPGV